VKAASPCALSFFFAAALFAAATTMAQTTAAEPADPYLWLEEVQGETALAWVRERNAQALQRLQARADFTPTRERLLAILDAKDRIPHFARRGEWLYNFWQDPAQPRGLWRRTTLAEYRKAQPVWETVLDVDALGKAEGENWVFGGSTCFGPAYRRCLLSLSRGGADASVVREFDTVDKRFVPGGFVLPEAKSEVDWLDADTLIVGTDFGPGSLTDSGYPRVLRRWQRGTPLAAAVTVFEGQAQDVSVQATVHHTPGHERLVLSRATDFFNNLYFVEERGQRTPLAVPTDASLSFWNHAGGRTDTMLLQLRSDWAVAGRTWRAGSLLATDTRAFLRGERQLTALFEPTATRSLAGYTTTRNCVIVEVLDNVASRVEEWRRTPGGFVRREIAAPFPGAIAVGGLNDPLLRTDPLAERYWLTHSGFTTPDSLQLGRTGSDRREALKALPAAFDATGMRVEQLFATSPDGTRVPYFVVWPKGATASGDNPTLLYGYGGFEVSMAPWYARGYGSVWSSRGGVLVVANIRGGGEFGPAWHQAALKANRQRAFDDFIAVAQDLIARRITSPRHLGIEGGSNGGLLVGAVMVQRPELFNAVVCQVPLLDMRRYHRLLAGASWMGEYGDPDDPAQWSYLSRYSPYQNVRAGVKMPAVLFTTSTRDDRVHPGHARKMAARMLEQGHEVLYFENIEGGHGAAADNAQRALMQALEFSFLWQQLGR
jgi:prolyl oligopeptidase